jgi:hypothetical protein
MSDDGTLMLADWWCQYPNDETLSIQISRLSDCLYVDLIKSIDFECLVIVKLHKLSAPWLGLWRGPLFHNSSLNTLIFDFAMSICWSHTHYWGGYLSSDMMELWSL